MGSATGESSQSATVAAPARTALSGLILVAALSALTAGIGVQPEAAHAANLHPCESTNPSGPKVELDGQLSLAPVRATRQAWRRRGIRQSLIRPASGLTGRPTFPVRAVRYGRAARVAFRGGLLVTHGRRRVAIRGLRAYSAPGRPAWLRGRIGRRMVNLFRVGGGKRFFNRRSGEFSRVGVARLTPSGARVLNRQLRFGKRKRLRTGTAWGYFNLYALYNVSEVEDPIGEAPEVPPVKPEPAGALAITSATTVKWYVRDSFIEYLASGAGTRVAEGATADPPTGPSNLVYSFNFPFAAGWTVPSASPEGRNTLVKGSGKVGFRYCLNTINFTASDPEVEIDGDQNSRLIFHVNGTDGTPFPDQRAVMVKLLPSRAASESVIDNGDGTKTVSYKKMPGFIPAEATGIFADFYPSYNPVFEGQEPRPDRFGYLSLTYTYEEDQR